jgi:hypothetical protein
MWTLIDPRRPVVTNLRLGNYRHLATMVLDTSGRRHRRRSSHAKLAATIGHVLTMG